MADPDYGEGKRRGTRLQTLEEQYNLQLSITSKLERSLGPLKDLPFAVVGLNKVSQAIVQAMGEIIKFNREGLKFNRTFNEALAFAGDRIEGLPGGLFTSMRSLFAFQSAGLMDSSRSALNLANKMDITGQNTAGLIKLNQKLITQGLLSSRQRATFNESLDNLSMRFNVSTELLIGSLDNLGKSLPLLGLTGSMQTTQAIKELTAQFPALGGDISTFVDMLLKSNIGDLARLGIDDDVAKLFTGAGATPSDILSIIQQTQRGAAQFGDFKDLGSIVELQQLQNLAGPAGMLGTQLQAALENAKPSPAQESLSKIFTDVATSLKTTFEPFVRTIGDFLLPLVSGFGSIVAALDSFGALTTVLKVTMVTLIGNLALQTTAVLMNTAAIIKSAAVGAFSTMRAFGAFGLVPLAIGAAPVLLPLLLGLGVFAILSTLADSTEKLATAEELRAKADLRGIDDDEKALSRFEAVTAALIGDFIQSQSMADSIAVASTDAQIERLDTLAAIFDSKIDELIGTEGGVTFA
jgi:hypothetical protein|tara:strand:+ start:6240 stop:7808 length:1569 start_codon:yes stop_codon:yes gene_type:complete